MYLPLTTTLFTSKNEFWDDLEVRRSILATVAHSYSLLFNSFLMKQIPSKVNVLFVKNALLQAS